MTAAMTTANSKAMATGGMKGSFLDRLNKSAEPQKEVKNYIRFINNQAKLFLENKNLLNTFCTNNGKVISTYMSGEQNSFFVAAPFYYTTDIMLKIVPCVEGKDIRDFKFSEQKIIDRIPSHLFSNWETGRKFNDEIVIKNQWGNFFSGSPDELYITRDTSVCLFLKLVIPWEEETVKLSSQNYMMMDSWVRQKDLSKAYELGLRGQPLIEDNLISHPVVIASETGKGRAEQGSGPYHTLKSLLNPDIRIAEHSQEIFRAFEAEDKKRDLQNHRCEEDYMEATEGDWVRGVTNRIDRFANGDAAAAASEAPIPVKTPTTKKKTKKAAPAKAAPVHVEPIEPTSMEGMPPAPPAPTNTDMEGFINDL